MDTTFYVIGGSLTVLALIISFIGMKSEKFPTDAQLRIGIGLFAAVVVVTAVFAVRASQEEALHREHEENIEASAEEEQATLEGQDEENGVGSSGTPLADDEQAPGDRDEVDPDEVEGATGQGDPAQGLIVFTDQGCGSCHSLEAADATGQIGPNLDVELVEEDEAYIETSIIDPSADIVEGFSDGIMPPDYGEVIPPDDLADLVAFLYDSTHPAAK